MYLGRLKENGNKNQKNPSNNKKNQTCNAIELLRTFLYNTLPQYVLQKAGQRMQF